MAARRSTKIRASLLAKGFHDTGGDHHRLVLRVEGRETGIRTKVSRGNKDYGDDLLKLMREQLRLRTKRQLLELIDCPISYDDYVALLRDTQALAPES